MQGGCSICHYFGPDENDSAVFILSNDEEVLQ